MKFLSVATSVILLASSAIVSAWELTLYMEDGGHVTATGTFNSGCVDWDFDMTRSPVNRAVFSDSFFADTFELYEGKGCNPPVSYREGAGDHIVQPSRVIQSYKAY